VIWDTWEKIGSVDSYDKKMASLDAAERIG
jgi:hypothetical protein